MKNNCHKARILALEIRSRRMAFAVLEGIGHLLECGIRRWPSGVNAARFVMDRIDPVLALYSPSVVVLKRMTNARKMRTQKATILAVKRGLTKRLIDVYLVGGAEVREVFKQSGSQNKYLIAAAIAKMFPELKWKLPQKRRPWQTERYNAAIFDAVALAWTCRSQSTTTDQPVET